MFSGVCLASDKMTCQWHVVSRGFWVKQGGDSTIINFLRPKGVIFDHSQCQLMSRRLALKSNAQWGQIFNGIIFQCSYNHFHCISWCPKTKHQMPTIFVKKSSNQAISSLRLTFGIWFLETSGCNEKTVTSYFSIFLLKGFSFLETCNCLDFSPIFWKERTKSVLRYSLLISFKIKKGPK